MWRLAFLLFVLAFGLQLDSSTTQSLNLNPNPNPKKNSKPARTLAPCQACRLFVESFERGLARTERGKFEGGDAAWEEERLGSYSRSEVRLVEIQEKLCSEKEVEEHRDRCHSVADLAEPHVEEWWSEPEHRSTDLFAFVCVERLRSCCPKHHYGESCLPCRGGAENPCSGNGKCKGDGTRKGNGECACDAGYEGVRCDSCSPGYYESYKDDEKSLCSECHKACRGGCTRGGVTGCVECGEGWIRKPNEGCVDVDECLERSACDKNEFCVNEEGSFKCLDCDKSCDGCDGDGPDACKRCASGYQLKDDVCVDSGNAKMSQRVTVTRYLTYLGLCVTVCIIFQKSTILAGVLGLLVTMYISVSEYMLAGDRGFSPTIDPNQIDLAKLLGKS